MDTFGPQSLFGTRKERMPRVTLKKVGLSAPYTCTLPLPPTPARIYWQIPYYKIRISGPFVPLF